MHFTTFVRVSVAAAAALLVAFALSSSAQGAILSFWSGNTNPGANPGPPPGFENAPTGTINFGVGDNAEIVALNAFAHTGTLDTTAAFIYLYQVTDNTVDIGSSAVALNASLLSSLTSFGYFTGRGFHDGAEVTNANPFGTFDGVYSNLPDPATLGVATPTTVSLLAGTFKDPTTVTLNDIPLSAIDSLGVTFSGTSLLLPGDRSSLIYFTSNFAPKVDNGTITDGGTGVNGFVISPTDNPDQILPIPEPASLLVWGLGVGLVMGTGALRRRKQVA